ncbi:MAG: 3-isopropylmalate dehydratase small subunit [Hyphomonadaceae bacterium]|nr:3-isopropylmalate dehydratase small subunit [Hyphomonadaceae bacterium]
MRFEPFVCEKAHIAALPAANIDTDVIMPKTFLKGIDRKGLDVGAFHHLRFASDGVPRADFVLNQAPWTQAKFLVTGENFGCGSSREHAVWGLLQLGIRAVVAQSFGGIFFDNCARNGLLAIESDEADVERLSRHANAGKEITIDLDSQSIITPGETIGFDIGERRKFMLMNGLDAIGITLKRRDEIASFENEYLGQRKWLAGKGVSAA